MLRTSGFIDDVMFAHKRWDIRWYSGDDHSPYSAADCGAVAQGVQFIVFAANKIDAVREDERPNHVTTTRDWRSGGHLTMTSRAPFNASALRPASSDGTAASQSVVQKPLRNRRREWELTRDVHQAAPPLTEWCRSRGTSLAYSPGGATAHVHVVSSTTDKYGHFHVAVTLCHKSPQCGHSHAVLTES